MASEALSSMININKKRSLFTILDITNSTIDCLATVAVKRAYRRLSLKVHPDRVGKKEKKAATCKFQVLGKVYSILSDTDKRAIYDETGMWGPCYHHGDTIMLFRTFTKPHIR